MQSFFMDRSGLNNMATTKNTELLSDQNINVQDTLNFFVNKR